MLEGKKKFDKWADVLAAHKKRVRRKNSIANWEKKRENALMIGEYLPKKRPKRKKRYYKLKMGPRKGKRRKKRIKIRPQLKYNIYLSVNDKLTKRLGEYNNLKEMGYALKEFKKQNDGVIIPNEYVKDMRLSLPVKRDLIVARKKKKGEGNVTYLPDDMGRMAPYATREDDKYVILNKVPIFYENWFKLWDNEHSGTFFTFIDIWNDFILGDLNNKFNFKRVVLFKNKLLIEGDDKSTIILCRCISESITLYNKIMEYKIKYHKHNVIPGTKIFDGKHELHRHYIEKIMELTGWSEWKTTYKY